MIYGAAWSIVKTAISRLSRVSKKFSLPAYTQKKVAENAKVQKSGK
jgi:hypothetical protein